MLSLYKSALRIRMVEDAIAKEYPKAEMKSPTHLYTGEEAIAAGICAHLKPTDYLFAYYRSHGWYLAKGGDLRKMLAELYGKADGCSGGFGGSMHLIDLKVGFQGTTALVAAAMPHAVGAAFAFNYRNEPRVAVSTFGDGATEEGLFQESLMFSALRKLPAIFVCENNGLATNTWIKFRQPPHDIYKRAAGFGVHSVQIDGNDALAVSQASEEAVKRARSGNGPTFIEAMTYRVLEHCGPNSDVPLGFRSQSEVDAWKERDPISLLEKNIEESERQKCVAEITAEIEDAFAFARQAPFPPSVTPEGYAWL